MKFDIKLTDDSQKKIEGLAAAGKLDLRPTLRVIGTGYRKEVNLIFSKQQPRGEGQRWAPLSQRYAIRKAIEFPGAPMLVRHGTLLASMTVEGAPGNISIISKTGAVFGSSIYYGIYHDSDEVPRGTLPRRNFSEPSDRRRDIWIRQIIADIAHNFEVNGIQVDGDIISGE